MSKEAVKVKTKSKAKKETSAKQDAANKVAETESTSAPAISRFDDLDRQFDSLFPSFWTRPFRSDFSRLFGDSVFSGVTPAVDVIDQDAELVIRAELPGVSKDDLEVSVTDSAVAINAEVKSEKEESGEKERYYSREIRRSSYARTVTLPTTVDGEKATATFVDGVLELRLPKTNKTHRVNVEVA